MYQFLIVVTYISCDDATLPPEARELIIHSFPSMDILARLHCYSQLLVNLSITFYLSFYSTKTVTILGKEFRPGAIICITPPSNLAYPTFGEIIQILLSNESKQFLVCLYHTETYSAHFNLYQVVKINQFSIICVNKLGIHEVYHKYFVPPRMYVVVKSYHHIEYDI